MGAVKRRGRPRKPERERLISLTANVPPELYDQFCKLAEANHLYVSELARDVLQQFVNYATEKTVGPF